LDALHKIPLSCFEVLAKLEKEERITLKEVDINAIARRNQRLLSGLLSVPRERKEFFDCLANKGIYTAYKKFVRPIWLRRRLYALLCAVMIILKNIFATVGNSKIRR